MRKLKSAFFMRLTQLLNGARLDCFPAHVEMFFFVCGKLNRNKIHPFHLHPARKIIMRLEKYV